MLHKTSILSQLYLILTTNNHVAPKNAFDSQ